MNNETINPPILLICALFLIHALLLIRALWQFRQNGV